MNTQIKLALIGLPDLDPKIMEAARNHMPAVVAAGYIEYENITPRSNAADVAATVAGLAPDIILLGFPQDAVSAWEIAEELLHFSLCPIILVRRSKSNGTNGGGEVPNGYPVIDAHEVAHICSVIQSKLEPKLRPKAGAKK